MASNRQFFFLFQAKDVNIVVVGVGKNFPEKESNLKDIAGSKGKTLRYSNFDALSGKVDEILNEMCGKAFAFLFFFWCFFFLRIIDLIPLQFDVLPIDAFEHFSLTKTEVLILL